MNFSKTGVSTTIGPRGANVNFGKNGAYLNTGIPGTGLYSRKKLGGGNNSNTPPTNNFTSNTNTLVKSKKSKTTTILLALFLGGFGAHRFYLGQYWRGIFCILFFITWIPTIISLIDVLIFGLMSQEKFDDKYNNKLLSDASISSLSFTSTSNTTAIPTSKSLEELKKHIEEARQERQELRTEISKQQFITKRLEKSLKNKQSAIGKIFAKQEAVEQLQKEVTDANEYLTDLCNQYEESQADINIECEDEIKEQYQRVKDTYIELLKSDKIWDIVSKRAVTEIKSSIKTSIDRKEVRFTFDDIDFILSEHSAFHLENADGDNLYIFPAFILQINNSGGITLIDLHDLRFRFHKQRFQEDKSTTPKDTQVVDYTWEKVNKDGSPDRRYSNNYRIPIVEYGAFEFSTNSGLQETYYISNVLLAERFANEFRKYLSFLTPTSDFSTSEISTNTNRIKTNDFSYQYCSLLKDFSKSLVQIVHKLQTNEAILERINGGNLDTASEEFIAHCVVYDMVQVSNILAKGNLSTKSLEATGMVLATTHLLSNSNETMIDNDFDTLSLAYKRGLFQKTAQELLDIGAMENPMQISIQEMQNEKVISSTKQQNNLSFPTFLKISDNPLFDEYVTVLYRYANIISKADNVVTKEEERLLKEIYQITHYPIPQKKNEALHISKANNKNETLDDVLNEFNSLIGLSEVKSEINTLINFIKVQRAREQSGLKSSSLSYHIVFTGNPGTGKTTVARIVAKIYKHLGILTDGQLVETDRSGLVAEYVGQTAVKVNNTINSALNGVLFIDEAYSLVGENKDDFGKEAVATLIKRMEDDRDKLVLILAGYTNEMNTFIDTNPGFKSRFNRYISFPDYTPNELFDIFESNCEKLDYHLTEEAKEKLKSVFENAYSTRDKSFGNGRFVRNTFEKVLEQKANRIAKESNLTNEILTSITEDDIMSVS